jgi:hypothetical protein
LDKDLEVFWREVLSGDRDRVRKAISRLPLTDREPVEVHLKRMASKPGWTEGQKRRARAALEAMDWMPD